MAIDILTTHDEGSVAIFVFRRVEFNAGHVGAAAMGVRLRSPEIAR